MQNYTLFSFNQIFDLNKLTQAIREKILLKNRHLHTSPNHIIFGNAGSVKRYKMD
jgi:hypothetical protein